MATNICAAPEEEKEALTSAYLLISEIHTYWKYGDDIALPRT